MARQFNTLLKALRLKAGYGLREFAEMIGESPSNYVGRESGALKPWRQAEKLRKVAEGLALREGTEDWDAFFIAAGQDRVSLPPTLETQIERPFFPALLRTIKELSEDELRDFVNDLRKKKGLPPL
jgi:transcriptional regulator with XRE-family HTH domain